jgi:hypothetical protein
LVQTLYADPSVDRHARVVRVLKLRATVGDARLEAACARALEYDELTYATLKRILEQHLEAVRPPTPPPPAPARTFARSAGELLGHLFGGLAWN